MLFIFPGKLRTREPNTAHTAKQRQKCALYLPILNSWDCPIPPCCCKMRRDSSKCNTPFPLGFSLLFQLTMQKKKGTRNDYSRLQSHPCPSASIDSSSFSQGFLGNVKLGESLGCFRLTAASTPKSFYYPSSPCQIPYITASCLRACQNQELG